MNIKKMLEAQKKLDEANLKKAGIEEYPIEEVKTAYRVELGELLQEWKEFKYWKLSKGEIDREELLEEWADCCHFALSLENEEIEDYENEEFKEENFTALPRMDIYCVIDICFETKYSMKETCFNCKHIKSDDWRNSIFYCDLDKLTLTYEQVNYFYCKKFKSAISE